MASNVVPIALMLFCFVLINVTSHPWLASAREFALEVCEFGVFLDIQRQPKSYMCVHQVGCIYIQFIIFSSWFISDKRNNILTFEIIIFRLTGNTWKARNTRRKNRQQSRKRKNLFHQMLIAVNCVT